MLTVMFYGIDDIIYIYLYYDRGSCTFVLAQHFYDIITIVNYQRYTYVHNHIFCPTHL